MTREVLQQAFEALDRVAPFVASADDNTDACAVYQAIDAIKAALAEPEQNLACNSTQARLAASWGYVKVQPEQEPVGFVVMERQPLTHEQRLDLLTKFEPSKSSWNAESILIDMVEAAHNIGEKT
jgi:hypothetical protein